MKQQLIMLTNNRCCLINTNTFIIICLFAVTAAASAAAAPPVLEVNLLAADAAVLPQKAATVAAVVVQKEEEVEEHQLKQQAVGERTATADAPVYTYTLDPMLVSAVYKDDNDKQQQKQNYSGTVKVEVCTITDGGEIHLYRTLVGRTNEILEHEYASFKSYERTYKLRVYNKYKHSASSYSPDSYEFIGSVQSTISNDTCLVDDSERGLLMASTLVDDDKEAGERRVEFRFTYRLKVKVTSEKCGGKKAAATATEAASGASDIHSSSSKKMKTSYHLQEKEVLEGDKQGKNIMISSSSSSFTSYTTSSSSPNIRPLPLRPLGLVGLNLNKLIAGMSTSKKSK